MRVIGRIVLYGFALAGAWLGVLLLFAYAPDPRQVTIWSATLVALAIACARLTSVTAVRRAILHGFAATGAIVAGVLALGFGSTNAAGTPTGSYRSVNADGSLSELRRFVTPTPGRGSTAPAPFQIVPGATGHMATSTSGPVNEGVRYMYDRADQEGDAKGKTFASSNYEWIFAFWKDQIRVIQPKGAVVQIELLSGKSVGRRLWVHADEIGP